MAPARSNEDELITTILPSYHMFQLTISKRLVPRDDNFRENFRESPPTYELSPLNSGAITPVASAVLTPTVLPEMPDFPFPVSDGENEDFAQNSAQLFEKTILANVHRLDSLAETSSKIPNHLDVEITFTDSVCQKGIKPNIIDVSSREYKQDDYLHGYVTMTNRNTEAIPFDMVYVVFEGALVVVQSSKGPRDQQYPPTMFKFLNMPDLFASWTYANINRLVTDEGNPHDWCVGETDPYDDTMLLIDAERLFQPGVTYKRFFSFRVPNRLLDDTCDVHSLDVHCQLLPTLGNLSSLFGRAHDFSDRKIKDFLFMDTFISYSVSTKIIGKLSQYNVKVAKDKYVLTKEVSLPVRVLPYTTQHEYPEYWAKKVNACYKAFRDTVELKIEEGQLVLLQRVSSLSLLSLVQLSPQSSRVLPTGLNGEKLRHLYQVSATLKNTKSDASQTYLNLTLYRRKTLTGFLKVLGVFLLSTPKTTYKLKYVPPPAHRNPLQGYNNVLEIPLEVSYNYDASSEKQAPPEPKSVVCELIVLTVRSKKHLIPVELNHEMCFHENVVDDVNTKKNVDEYPNFDTIVIKPFHDYFHKLVSIMKKVGFDNDAFRVETELFKSLKSMAMLQTKYINLAVPDVTLSSSSESGGGTHKNVGSIPWEESVSSVNGNYKIFTKNMNLTVNLDSCHLKGASPPGGKSAFDTFTLVPDFQSCLVARFYYMRISVKHKSGATQVVHVPVSIES